MCRCGGECNVTNYHKSRGLRHWQFMILWSWRSLNRNQGVRRAVFLPEVLRMVFLLLFPHFQVHGLLSHCSFLVSLLPWTVSQRGMFESCAEDTCMLESRGILQASSGSPGHMDTCPTWRGGLRPAASQGSWDGLQSPFTAWNLPPFTSPLVLTPWTVRDHQGSLSHWPR